MITMNRRNWLGEKCVVTMDKCAAKRKKNSISVVMPVRYFTIDDEKVY